MTYGITEYCDHCGQWHVPNKHAQDELEETPEYGGPAGATLLLMGYIAGGLIWWLISAIT